MKRRFAVFDIDGTLIRWQLYHAVVDRLAKKGHLGLDAHERIHQERMTWKRREHNDAFNKYEHYIIERYEAAIEKLDSSVFDDIVKEVANEYKDQVYTYTRSLIKTLKDQDYCLLAVSGSHHELVEIVAKQHGFDDWVGTDYERQAGRFTGKRFIASHDKRQVLEDLTKKHGLSYKDSYAIGDSQSDAAMLELVTNPIAFNPDQKLFQYAHKRHWPVVVERKNMVYELQYKHDTYVLAQTNTR